MSLTDAFSVTAQGLSSPEEPGFRRARFTHIALTFAGTVLTVGLFAASVSAWTPLAAFALVLVSVSAAWISGGAATAFLGAMRSLPRPARPSQSWVPMQKTAILVTLCGEDSGPLAAYLDGLTRALERSGMGRTTRVVVLSDTSDPKQIVTEEANLGSLVDNGALTYRRRSINHGRKPGNIAEWVRRSGAGVDFMLVLDADSRMSVWRIRKMIWQMEQRPTLGLLQAGIALVPGRTLFGRYQRLSARLLSPNFLRGFAAWTGPTGNYWGHNALIRLSAFRSALDLPILPGLAPFGGQMLSHDFVEAAWIRRAGWSVEVEPELEGSAEDAPQTPQEFFRRDRRWCQGNLQHIRILAEPGLHPVSRVHLTLGIISYLAAPIWLSLLLLVTSGAVRLDSAFPLLPVTALLLAPKLFALPGKLTQARTARRRRRIGHAFIVELAMSAVLAPIIMVRQTGAVIAVLLGQDCGWKRHVTRRLPVPHGVPEAMVGLALCALAVMAGSGTALWLTPLMLPLLLAPAVVRLMETPA